MLTHRTLVLCAILSLSLGMLAMAMPSQAIDLNITPPDPQIPIPGLSKFEVPTPFPCDENRNPVEGDLNSEETQRCLDIPWLGQYIRGIYQFSVQVVTILAVIVVMVAGFVWLTAGGNSGQVSTAKGYIMGAIIGLALMLGSYTILTLVNPELVIFKSLVLEIPKTISLEEYTRIITESGGQVQYCAKPDGSPAPLVDPNNPYQDVINELAPQIGVSPVFVGSIMKNESNFKPTAESYVGAFGLMQVMPETLQGIWNSVGRQGDTSGCTGKFWTDKKVTVTIKGEKTEVIKKEYNDACKASMQANTREQIRTGIVYLKMVHDTVQGCGGEAFNLSLVAAGYNAGPNRPDTLCKSIVPTFDETLEYVRRNTEYSRTLCQNAGGTETKFSRW